MPEQNTPKPGSLQTQPGESSGAGQTNRPDQTDQDEDEKHETTGGTPSEGAEESDS